MSSNVAINSIDDDAQRFKSSRLSIFEAGDVKPMYVEDKFVTVVLLKMRELFYV